MVPDALVRFDVLAHRVVTLCHGSDDVAVAGSVDDADEAAFRSINGRSCEAAGPALSAHACSGNGVAHGALDLRFLVKVGARAADAE